MKNKKECHLTSIGGQAVIEGVMMRGPKEIAVSVRKSDGEIITEKKPVASVIQKNKLLKLPIIRGCISFFESLIIGMKALMFSADFYDVEGEEEVEESKFEKWLDDKFGDKIKDIMIYFSVIVSLILGIGIFIILPSFIVSLFKIGANSTLKTVLEGVIRIIIFLLYLYFVSKMEDIKRVFMYHGAEHKSIACYESGMELNVENARKCTRFHPRCGTSFLLIVMVVSLFVFMIIPGETTWIGRICYRLLLLPVVAGLSYEIIKYAGRHDNAFTHIVSAPGLWMQRLTTREPEDSMIEVALTSLKAVMTGNKEDDKW